MIRPLQSLLDRLRDNHMARAIAVLVGGAALAHVITALALPILSRLYTPEDFAALAVFNGIFTVLTVAACLRFDIAVPLPKEDGDALNLLALAIGIAGGVSIILLCLALLFSREIADLVNQPVLADYLWILPLGVFLSASGSALQNWHIRKKGFGMIASSRIAQSAGAVTLQFGAAALLKAGPFGLILGSVFNTSAAAVILGFAMLRERVHRSFPVTRQNMASVARVHRDFPRYSTFEALCNMASLQLPVILISAFAAGAEPGFVLLAITVLQAPMALFGIAIGQLYLSHAPGEHRSGNLPEFTITTTNMLIRSGVGPLIAGGIAAPFLFGYIFGDDWERAGTILAWMTPWFVMQFVTSPISMALIVTGHQSRALALQIFGLLCRTGAVYVAWLVDLRYISEAYALSGLVSYFIYYVVVMRTIGAPIRSLATGLISNWLVIAMWIMLSMLTIGAARFLLGA
jgi:O-antigen/teichoic acid export membrane protein